ncbi:MAG: TIM barrel protein [Chitinophagaceae bacterium]
MSTQSRRQFLTQLTLAGIAVPLIGKAGYLDPSYKSSINFGYSAITWGGKDDVAIREISSLGFKGIQLRANAFTTYKTKVDELKKMLKEARLTLDMFSSGNADVNTGKDEETIAMHLAHAKFVKELGGSFIQITNSSRPKEGAPSDADLKQYGRLLTEIGKQTKAVGVTVAYHNHMGQLGQTPEEVDIILGAADPNYVCFELDVAHYTQGGGDSTVAIRKHAKRIKALHLKDVRDVPGSPGKYVFVELGQGRVDFPAIFKALDEISFKGSGIIELDGVPDKTKTPLECAITSKEYLKSLHFNI